MRTLRLPLQPQSGGTVGAVNLRMAGGAIAPRKSDVWRGSTRHVSARHQQRVVSGLRVALLTEQGAGRHQQFFVIGTVRRVAVQAAVTHGRVFE